MGLHATWSQEVRPGMTVVSWADFSVPWEVISVSTRVADRLLEMEMQNGKRVITRSIAYHDVVLRR